MSDVVRRKGTMLRIPYDQAEQMDRAAQVLGLSVNEFILQAVTRELARLYADPDFRERLARRIQDDQAVLDRAGMNE